MRRHVFALVALAGALCLLAVASTASAQSTPELPAEEPVSSEVPSNPPAANGEADSQVGLLAEQGCPANNVCTYSQPFFEGTRHETPCSSSGYQLGWGDRSARNRCGNKLNKIEFANGTWICMNPGGDRPNPGYQFNYVFLPSYYGPPWC